MTWQDNHEHENLEVAKSKSIRWVGHVARMEKKKTRNAYNILVRKPEERKTLGRPRRRWADNIRIDLRGSRVGKLWTTFIWLSIGTSGGLL
jgi:hypothetical protein